MEKYPKAVLLEFQFTNSDLVPPGAKRVARNENAITEKRRCNGVAAGEHGQAEQVTVKPFVKQLFGLGYKVANLHFYTKVPNGDGGNTKTRFVLVINFTRGSAIQLLSKDDVRILDQLVCKDAWGHFHLWENPNGVMSVHCLHRVPNGGKGEAVGEFLLESPVEEGFTYEEVMRS